jgi:hypothetical protein
VREAVKALLLLRANLVVQTSAKPRKETYFSSSSPRPGSKKSFAFPFSSSSLFSKNLMSAVYAIGKARETYSDFCLG